MLSTRVTFPARSDASPSAPPLVGTLLAPTAPPLPARTPTALLCHGLADHADARLLVALATGLEAAGVASLRFDFGGNGASARARPFRFGNCRAEAADVAAAAAAVAAWGGRVVAAVGHSKGASSVLLAAAGRGDGVPRPRGRPPPLPTVVNIAGRHDHADLAPLVARFGDDVLERTAAAGEAGVPLVWRVAGAPVEWRLTRADVDDRRTTDMAAAAASLPAATRVLHVHGAEDAVVPPSAAAAYGDGTAHCAVSRVLLVDGADHNFTGEEALAALVEAVVAFVREGVT